MKKATSICKLISGIITVINALCVLFTRTSCIFPMLPIWFNIVCTVVFVVLGTLLVFGSILEFTADSRRSVQLHKFQYQSEAFFNFFSEWYKQPGKLSIICGDLDWIKNEKNMTVYNQLLTKSDNRELKLLMGNGIHSEIVSELKRHGAKVMPAPNNIVSTYTFSCLSLMDDVAGKIIVRDKHRYPTPSTGETIFEEISDSHIITELLNALLTKEA
jgi:hypothetical protein